MPCFRFKDYIKENTMSDRTHNIPENLPQSNSKISSVDNQSDASQVMQNNSNNSSSQSQIPAQDSSYTNQVYAQQSYSFNQDEPKEEAKKEEMKSTDISQSFSYVNDSYQADVASNNNGQNFNQEQSNAQNQAAMPQGDQNGTEQGINNVKSNQSQPQQPSPYQQALAQQQQRQAYYQQNANVLHQPRVDAVCHKKSFQENLGMHILMVAIISLCLMVPTVFFDMILDDRQSNQSYAISSMSKSWADEQKIGDPQIYVPVNTLVGYEKRVDGNVITSKNYQTQTAYINPEKSESKIHIISEKRYRGNYEATLYTANITQKAVFNLISSAELLHQLSEIEDISLDNATIGFSVEDSRGIDEIKNLKVNGKEVEALPARKFSGFEIPLKEIGYLDDDSMVTVEINYLLRGSQSFSFSGLGKISEISISGEGSVPSFIGNFLPREREVLDDQKSFTAFYYLNNMATGQSEVSLEKGYTKDISVVLKDESQSYILINRLLKYVLLFIAMTFVSVLAFEIVYSRLVSLVQYVVIGVALILFYMILLALSEHINFTLSYIVGSLLMASMIALYLKAVFQSKKYALAIFIMLLTMYSVLFAIVHIEAYALLVGTILLVMMLGVIMYITRHLNAKYNKGETNNLI